MKKLFLSLFIASALVPLSLTAQNNAPEGKEGMGKGPGFFKELNLTEEQKQEIDKINKDFFEKNKSLRESQKEQIDGILTAEQKSKLQELRENMKKEFKGREGENAPGPFRGGERRERPMGMTGGKLFDKLNLTADQKTKIEALNKDFAEKTKDLREQEKTLAKNNREQIDNILTADQKEQLKNLRKERRENSGKGMPVHQDENAPAPEPNDNN